MMNKNLYKVNRKLKKIERLLNKSLFEIRNLDLEKNQKECCLNDLDITREWIRSVKNRIQRKIINNYDEVIKHYKNGINPKWVSIDECMDEIQYVTEKEKKQ